MNLHGIELFDDPRPEKIVALDGLGQSVPKECGELKIGLCKRTVDNGGRKIIPLHEVYFSIDGNIFTVGPSLAEDIAIRLNELAQEARRRPAGRTQPQ
ncbi:MAG: hypothetical protein KGL39_06495 [Patescibacteria group bacterium]|nr:hypothetical protein [Patescibacteria group bacterium]